MGQTAEVLARRFPEVEVVRFARNNGFSKAVNRAAAVASSQTIVVLNDDCVCDPGFAERLAGALDPSRGVAICISSGCLSSSAMAQNRS